MLDCIITLCKLSIFPHYLTLSNWYNTTGFMNIVPTALNTAKAVPYISRCVDLWPVTSEARVRFRTKSISFYGKSDHGTVFFSSTSSFPLSLPFPPLPHTHPFIHHQLHINLLIQSAVQWRSLKQNSEINFKMLCRTFINVPEFADVCSQHEGV